MASELFKSSVFKNLIPPENLQKSPTWCTLCKSKEDPAGSELHHSIRQNIHNLWKSKTLCDFRIIVQGQSFQVHKVFVAAASDVLLAMLTLNMQESRQDFVELKAVTAVGMTQLLEFIYTGHMILNDFNIDDVIAAASHLQVRAAMTECSLYLKNHLSVDNAVDILSMANVFGLNASVRDNAFEFIVEHFHTIVRSRHILKLDFNDFKEILTCDKLNYGPEEKLFCCVNDWINHDSQNRNEFAASLFGCLRLFLIPESKLSSLTRSSEYFTGNESCSAFLEEANGYFALPIQEKVTHQSVKKNVRNEMSVITFGGAIGSEENFHCYALEETDWLKLPDMQYSFQGAAATVLDNFLIICGGMIGSIDVSNKCYVFDPRTFTWSNLPPMISKRGCFPITHHQGFIYAFGGCTRRLQTVPHFINGDSIERLNLKDNKWENMGVLGNALRKHSACALGDLIYISGGIDEMYMSTAKLQSYNPKEKLWKECAAMSNVRFGHCMAPHGNNIYVADPMNREIEYYTPATDQWTQMRISYNHLPDAAQVVYKNKMLYFINGIGTPFDEEEERERICMEVFPVRERTATCMEIAPFPEDIRNLICCSLIIPWDVMCQSKTVSQSKD